jgi:hypothetical protein
MSKNITLAVSEAELAMARKYAAERSTTVNALVRRFLASLGSDSESRRQAAVARMIERSKQTPLAEYAPRLSRDQLWDRNGSAE